ncbi:MAG: Uma2 family endonuclease [Pseudomonadota bacterium]|nr:Uma2 family endonuclease [Pseudomonadota bacterium]
MSALAAIQPELVSVQDYLQGEAAREGRHEYLAGQVVAMTGASRKHGLIATALSGLLLPHARQKGCQLFIADMKVRIDHEGDTWFYYPDLVLDCHSGEAEEGEAAFVRQPCLIVEVLSPSTEHIDTREKLLAYRLLPGLRGYLLLRQDRVQADLYTRAAGSPWQHERHTSGTLRLPCLDAEVALADVYQDVAGLV